MVEEATKLCNEHYVFWFEKSYDYLKDIEDVSVLGVGTFHGDERRNITSFASFTLTKIGKNVDLNWCK